MGQGTEVEKATCAGGRLVVIFSLLLRMLLALYSFSYFVYFDGETLLEAFRKLYTVFIGGKMIGVLSCQGLDLLEQLFTVGTALRYLFPVVVRLLYVLYLVKLITKIDVISSVVSVTTFSPFPLCFSAGSS